MSGQQLHITQCLGKKNMKYTHIEIGDILRVGDVSYDGVHLSIIERKIDISIHCVDNRISIYTNFQSNDSVGCKNFVNDWVARKVGRIK